VTHKAKTILLLGFILDPENPQAGDIEILNALTVIEQPYPVEI
jgi:hypothetical protein